MSENLNEKKEIIEKKHSGRLSLHINSGLIYLLCTILTILSLLLFWLSIVNSTRTKEQIQQKFSLIPGSAFWQNMDIFSEKGSVFGVDLMVGFKNSMLVSGGTTLLAIYFSALTAYALVAYTFKGKKALFTIIIIMIMIPGQISMVGFIRFVINIGLSDSLLPLILPAIASPTTVFFLRQYLLATMQKDLIDAARIDGAGEFRIFNTIILPLMKPGLATMAIFTFVFSWNNFLVPRILLTSYEKYTLPIMISQLRADIYQTELGAIYWGITVSLIPLIIVYLALSKYIIRGVGIGAVKE